MTKDRFVLLLNRCIEGLLYVMVFMIPISKSAIEISFSLAFVCFVIKKILKPDFRPFKSIEYLFLSLFFVFCAISLLNSGEFMGKGMKSLFFKWGEYIAMFIVIRETFISYRHLRNALAVLLVSGTLIAVDGIFQQFTGIDFFRQRVLSNRITASFQNQNNLAAYLLPLNLLAFCLAVYSREGGKYRVAFFCLSFLLSVCMFLTFTRSVWVGFFSGLALMNIAFYKKKRLLLSVLTFVLVVALVPSLRYRFISFFWSDDASARIPLCQSAWLMIRENPLLGKGLGTFMDHYRQYKVLDIDADYYAHNCYLQIWAETGMFSLLSFLLLIGSILRKGIGAFKTVFYHRKDLSQSVQNEVIFFFPAVICGLVCASFGFLVHAFFDTHLYSLQLSALFWSLLAMLSAATLIIREEPIEKVKGLDV